MGTNDKGVISVLLQGLDPISGNRTCWPPSTTPALTGSDSQLSRSRVPVSLKSPGRSAVPSDVSRPGTALAGYRSTRGRNVPRGVDVPLVTDAGARPRPLTCSRTQGCQQACMPNTFCCPVDPSSRPRSRQPQCPGSRWNARTSRRTPHTSRWQPRRAAPGPPPVPAAGTYGGPAGQWW
jgi:hypothetical protein